MQFLEMQQEVLSRLRLDIGNSAQLALVKRWINQSQQEIWSRYEWPWALEREIVQTVPDVTTGTVSIAASGTTVTGVDTTFTSGDVGKYIQVSGSDDWYKVTAWESSSSITIEAPYVGTSALSAGTYILRKVYYNVSSSVDRILTVRQTTTPIKLTMVPFRQFDLFKPSVESTDVPTAYVVWGYDSSNRWTFALYPSPADILNLEIRYKKKATDMSANTDTSLIPTEWADTVLLDGALYRGLEYVRTGDDDKRAEFKQRVYEDGIARMMGRAEPSNDHHVVIQNRDYAWIPRGPRLPEDFGPKR